MDDMKDHVSRSYTMKGKRVLDKIETLIQYFQKESSVVLAFLFGSRAKGIYFKP